VRGARRPGASIPPATVAEVSARRPGSEPDLAEELELRDELLVACREVLLGVGTREAAALVAHIDALLDLDDEASPGSQPRDGRAAAEDPDRA
jgi:hypothetical protein